MARQASAARAAVSPTPRDLLALALAVAVALAGTGLLIFLATGGSKKILAALLGGLLCLVLAWFSGNPRLFCIWGLMLTLPFDLSKRFGPIIAKMGGETAFRIEMSDPFLAALALFLLRDILNGRRAGLRVPKATYLWLLIIGLGLMTILVGPWRMTAAHEVVRMIKVIILFVVLVNELNRPGRILHAAHALVASMVLQSTVGIIQYVTRAHLGLDLLGETGAGTTDQLMSDSVRSATAFRAGAFLSHPNIFGIFLAVLLPIAIALFFLRLGPAKRLLSLVGVAVGMAALIATLSRSGWVSFTVAFFVLLGILVFHGGLRRRSLLAALGAASALGLVCLMLAGPVLERVFESKASAMVSRWEYMQTAARMISAKPLLGWGLNGYVYAAPPFTKYGARGAIEEFRGTKKNPGNWLPPVHNIYLLWWAETGLIGLALHLAVITWILWIALANLRVRDERLFAVNAACLAGFAAFGLDGMFSFSLRINSMLRVFWVIAALTLAIHYWRLGERSRLEAVPRGAPGRRRSEGAE
jgi:putative inorganic carbon (HCO3(-)) transporter